MNSSLVMTVIGPDRPGLVESIAETVASHEGNWVESRMANLGGQFAGILRVELPADKQVALLQALRAGRVTVDTAAGRFTLPEHPKYWAGFVITGEP